MVVFFLCFCNSIALALAPKEVTNTYTFSELGWDKAVTLNGYKPTHSLYLPIGKALNAQKAIVHLKMSVSSTVNQETSLDIQFNQNSIRHISIIPGAKEQTLDVELPLTQLSPDWQTLTFFANFGSAHLCDLNTWIYVSPESSITLTTAPLPFQGTLNQLPYPFINPGSLSPVPVLLLLPKAFTSEAQSSLLNIALHLGKRVGDSKMRVSADVIGKSEAILKENNIIFIGLAQHLFKEMAFAPGTSEAAQVMRALNMNSGILLLKQSLFNPIYGLLVITGADETGLEKAVRTFIMPEFQSLGAGSLAIIDDINLNSDMRPSGDLYRASFKELGYTDQSVSGLGRHRLVYNIPLSNDRVPNRAHLKTFITTPAIPGNKKWQMILKVNGLKQSTFWIKKEHSIWEASIDAQALKPGVNTLEYLIDLHLEHENCSQEDYDGVWATIYSRTEFQSTFFDDFPMAMLNQLPVPFNFDVHVVLPEFISEELLNDLANLFFKWGQLIEHYPGGLKFYTANQVKEDFIRDNNTILIGTPDNNPWVKFALDYMPLQLNRHSRLLHLEQKKISISGSTMTGLLELVPSPWSERKAILLIAGDTDKAVSIAIEALTNNKKRMSLNGNIAILNADQSVEVFNSYDNRYVNFKHRVMMYASNLGKNIGYYIKMHPQIFIYLLVVLVPLIILLRRRRNK